MTSSSSTRHCYSNGEKQQLQTRLIFKEGSRLPADRFHGGKRRIKTIQFTYKTVGNWRRQGARGGIRVK